MISVTSGERAMHSGGATAPSFVRKPELNVTGDPSNSTSAHCCGLNVSPKFMCWKLNPQCNGFVKQGHDRQAGSTLTNGSVLIVKGPGLLLSVLLFCLVSLDNMIRKALSDDGTMFLDFSASRTVR
jgi:hypothetical protein